MQKNKILDKLQSKSAASQCSKTGLKFWGFKNNTIILMGQT